jgi:hypothetical protein
MARAFRKPRDYIPGYDQHNLAQGLAMYLPPPEPGSAGRPCLTADERERRHAILLLDILTLGLPTFTNSSDIARCLREKFPDKDQYRDRPTRKGGTVQPLRNSLRKKIKDAMEYYHANPPKEPSSFLESYRRKRGLTPPTSKQPPMPSKARRSA